MKEQILKLQDQSKGGIYQHRGHNERIVIMGVSSDNNKLMMKKNLRSGNEKKRQSHLNKNEEMEDEGFLAIQKRKVQNLDVKNNLNRQSRYQSKNQKIRIAESSDSLNSQS